MVDLGCGPGVSTFELAATLPTAQVVGIDIAPRMLAQARRRQGQAHVTWVLGDASNLPFGDASVAACAGHSFLYLVTDRAAALREAHRVLRPGGQLVLMEPSAHGASPAQVVRVSRDPRHLFSVSLWRPFSRVHGRFTPALLAETVEAAGFVDAEVEETLGGLGLIVRAIRP